ncbi:FERM central domain-containing protein [Ditylenchus destructor]|nr:FERM central domain-containing protein [Ditylenchus destructor]
MSAAQGSQRRLFNGCFLASHCSNSREKHLPPKMAHLIQDGFEINDQKWKLGIYVTDITISKDIYVRGDMTIGNLMMALVNEIGETQDWSDHALWWPDRRKWLKHTRSTLDQVGVTAATYLEFTPMHKFSRVQLPDLQVVDARLDFSIPVLRVTQELCRELAIRRPEELSLKRDIPPDILRKGANISEEAQFQPYIKPGEESVGPGTLRTMKPIRASTMNLNGRQSSPSLSASLGPGHIFNASEIGTLPRAGTLPRGVSPGPAAYREAVGRTPEPGFSEGLDGDDQFDENLIHSPKVVVGKDAFRPQNYQEKAALNRGWLDSSRSLMEQGISEGETVIVRFKFMSFFDINPKYDPVRINQLYEQAKWSILLEEIEHTEEEASLFAALQLQATLQRNTPERESPERDEVDVLLDELEQNLDAAATQTRRDLTHVPELTEYLKYLKPKKIGFNNFKRAYFCFRDLYLSYYNTAQDANGPPLGHFYLKGCEVSQDLSVSQGKFNIKLQVPTSEGMTDLVLKCDTEYQYAKWMAACRLASRGKTMADASYNNEVETIKKMLQMQAGKTQNGGPASKKQAPAVQLPSDFNVEEFVSQRFVRKARSRQTLQQRISDAHSNVRSLTSTEAKLQYIRTWEALPEHGIHYFIVKFRNNGKNDLIAVAHNRLMKINKENGESTKTWRYSGMKKWHVNWEIRHIKIQFDNEDIEFKPISADCKVVHEFIGGYIFVSLRSKDQKQALDEEGFHKLTGGWS